LATNLTEEEPSLQLSYFKPMDCENLMMQETRMKLKKVIEAYCV